jgi:hypothetical protein
MADIRNRKGRQAVDSRGCRSRRAALAHTRRVERMGSVVSAAEAGTAMAGMKVMGIA